ncbi:helix-turn-helix transcriptional regulator [Allorhizobium terrae]|uniref:YafY family transcriptional regulator n=1 Tax=Allorhizobium terrae TaxID=1848972 RepID=A0A4S3ZSL9_9HYPH|nr:YafY family protein [Allorhizobium terrae]THF48651.1 YafY family transcriptional regulator [Allorhizobium terrae]
MSRAERLLTLLQVLRRYRQPVRGQTLADELGISIRTLYRDIASLQAQGADIEGEPGLGYVLRPSYMLPPLMFSRDEIDALVLGARFVAQRTDDQLAHAARDALAKITAVLPQDLRQALQDTAMIVGPSNFGQNAAPKQQPVALADLREAIRLERVLRISYQDGSGTQTLREVWPFALSFFEGARVLMAWCCLRQSFRHFRTDRILECQIKDARMPKRRAVLLKQWHLENAIPERLF